MHGSSNPNITNNFKNHTIKFIKSKTCAQSQSQLPTCCHGKHNHVNKHTKYNQVSSKKRTNKHENSIISTNKEYIYITNKLHPRGYLSISKALFLCLPEHHAHCDIKTLFRIKKLIGEGITGKVFKAVYKNRNVALKAIKRSTKENEYAFVKETQLLMHLDHPNIIRLKDTLLDNNYFYMILEMGEIDLADYREYHEFSEFELIHIMKQLLSTVVYLHSKNICHRDLKPENIVFSRKKKCHPKIIDFGMAIIVKDDQMYDQFVGTPSYLSPERFCAHNGLQLKKSDVWAIGITCYELIVGEHCFTGKDSNLIFAKIIKNEWKWPDNLQILPNCAHFVEECLTYQCGKRPTAKEALKHSWIDSHNNNNNDVFSCIINNKKPVV